MIKTHAHSCHRDWMTTTAIFIIIFFSQFSEEFELCDSCKERLWLLECLRRRGAGKKVMARERKACKPEP
nr:hypothetical protein [Tanacetum cinerariifolium]